MNNIKVVNHFFTGGVWLAAWLFTVGLLHLGLVQGIFAIVIWPYYLGIHFSGLL
jgi:hypothetical protein